MTTEQPNGERKPGEGADDDQDVEGHSRAAALFIGARARALKPDRDNSAAKAADEALPPLTKRFPRMRDDSRK
jgi:hypothetical protein